MRGRDAGTFLVKTGAALAGVLRSAVGVDEVLLALGLFALTWGTWPVLGQAAFIVPGAVLVWLALPSRAPFIDRTPPPPPDTRRSR